MAGTKIVTRKLVSWHGRDEEFSNVYYFGDGGVGLSPSDTTANTLVNQVITAERLIFNPTVRFLGGSAYHMGANDGPGDTDAIATVELSAGTMGQMTPSQSVDMYYECAIDIRWLLGGRRYLRSMLHTCHAHGYSPTGAGSGTPSGSLSAALKAFAEKMLNGPWTDGYQRIAPNGDRPTVIQYQPYLEHRQFHRYRKRNAGLLG